jgi:hypothetical protein
MTTFMMIMLGIALLFHIFGVIPSTTPNSILLNTILNPQDIASSPIMITVLVALTLASGLSVFLGFYTRNVEYALMIPIGLALFTLMWDFLAVVAVISAASKILAVIIFGPLLFIWVLTVVDYIRGRD